MTGNSKLKIYKVYLEFIYTNSVQIKKGIAMMSIRGNT